MNNIGIFCYDHFITSPNGTRGDRSFRLHKRIFRFHCFRLASHIVSKCYFEKIRFVHTGYNGALGRKDRFRLSIIHMNFKFPLDMVGRPFVRLGQLLHQGRVVHVDELVEQCLLRTVRFIGTATNGILAIRQHVERASALRPASDSPTNCCLSDFSGTIELGNILSSIGK
ncbi:hypothetical protein EYC98_20820 [Halieaceae bacterium IMCC14734]|uniref:Uncharacterized protein n=1 Tax=Candidatus Litorirhabdus singularis TaxID=2518993 RepID=A0ABT3TPQ5_9GAMM|nr:hypothetical protein [Candidatus Litorirhabdus singularis]MCX2983312.1 hypothetical protein [Candidatus Litorirhabdus singularis]